jgi:phage terminase large subunit GpA-like protein
MGHRTVRLWVTPAGRANEASDCRVYAYAALCGLVHFGLVLNKVATRAEEQGSAIRAGAEAPPTPPHLAPRSEKRSLASRLA